MAENKEILFMFCLDAMTTNGDGSNLMFSSSMLDQAIDSLIAELYIKYYSTPNEQCYGDDDCAYNYVTQQTQDLLKQMKSEELLIRIHERVKQLDNQVKDWTKDLLTNPSYDTFDLQNNEEYLEEIQPEGITVEIDFDPVLS